jgi:hypothetical protein
MWQYAFENPVLYVDPSGNRPNPPPGSLVPPQTVGYNEKIPPQLISWLATDEGNAISQSLAPIFDRDGNFVARVNAAQFRIGGHEIWCEVDPNTGSCVPGTTINQNFCGQIVISAILHLVNIDITADWVVDRATYQIYPEGMGFQDLASFINSNAGGQFQAEVQRPGEDNIPQNLRDWILSDALVIPLVNITSGSQWNEAGGHVGAYTDPNQAIPHWVMITGISRQWNYKDQESPWNWVRIFNPFDNETEYYWWPDFKIPWRQSTNGGNFTAVLVRPTFHKE